MVNKKEAFEEIFQQLKIVAEISKVAIMESELKTMARRLVEYADAELFRIIAAIPGEAYFPSGHDIENRCRKARGLPVLKGLTQEQIEEFERQNIVSGQDPKKAKAGAAKKAKAGAAILRNTLKKAEIKPEDPLSGLDDFGPDFLDELDSF